MNKLIKMFSVMATLVLCGCTTPQIKPADEHLNNSNSSILNIRRPSAFVNAGVSYRTFVNGEYIGTLGNGDTVRRRVSPGKLFIEFKPYSLCIPDFITSTEKLDILIEPGVQYDIKMLLSLNSVTMLGNTAMINKSSNFEISRNILAE